ncbi:MAG: DUF433 domain-containing protein [Chloroflexi bacterium]|nr:DUF433 domain-containing protein [Chloroflexota bacterium]
MLDVEATLKVPLRVDEDGVIRVEKTRVTLDTIIAAFKNGETAEGIAQQYPTLTLNNVYAVITYYLNFRDEVEAYLLQRKAYAAQVRQQNESRFNTAEWRERLMTRRNQQQKGNHAATGH